MTNRALSIVSTVSGITIFGVFAACENGASLWWMTLAFAAIAVFDRCQQAMERK